MFALAWFISSATATRIKYDEDTYVDDEDRVQSVGYLKVCGVVERVDVSWYEDSVFTLRNIASTLAYISRNSRSRHFTGI
jgi:hypothetical protein